LSKLRIYTDENVDVRVAEGLRKRGVNAFSVREEDAIGIKDEEHFKKAQNLEAVIFTHDPDFLRIAEELVKQGRKHYGVIFVEMHRLSLGECIRRLALYSEILSPEEMINHIEFL